MKILHCADIHLDSPFTISDALEAEKRRLALRSTFSSIVLYAKCEKCDIVLVSGDLFDDECITKDTSAMLSSIMANAPECKFVIAPGNHDAYTEFSPYTLVKWPENVYIFKDERMSYFDFPEFNARIYGYAFTSDTMKKSPLENFFIPDTTKINILCAHGDVGVENSNYAPINVKDLERIGFDYAALGHIHKGTDILYAGKCAYAYSGCPEGRNFNETGYKGAIVGEVDKEKVNLKKVRFSQKRYEKQEIDVTGKGSIFECEPEIKNASSGFGEDTYLKIILKGVTSSTFYCDEEYIKSLVNNVAFLQVTDDTLALFDKEKLKSDKTLAGEFYRCLEKDLESEDEDTRTSAYQALKFGLRAINGMEIKL